MIHIEGNQFKLENTAVTLGKFDGIHIGHRKLLKEILHEKSFNRVLFTFDLNPLNLFSEKEVKLIYSNQERLRLLEQEGLDYFITFPFGTETVEMSPEVFIKEIIYKQLGAKKIVVGTDFRFGKNRAGDVRLLEEKGKEFGFQLLTIPKKEKNGREISSTWIRELLRKGRMKEVNELLGRAYHITGEILHGKKLGNTVGMPTINLIPEAHKLLPPFGVYASITKLDGKFFYGITYIGKKPTVGKCSISVETWIFDFDKDVYGKIATVYILNFIRSEVKFPSLEALKRQVDLDVKKAKDFFASHVMEVKSCL